MSETRSQGFVFVGVLVVRVIASTMVHVLSHPLELPRLRVDIGSGGRDATTWNHSL